LSKRLTMRSSPITPSILFFTRYVEVEPAWLAEFTSYFYAKNDQLRLIVAGQPLRPDGDSAFRQAVSAANPALTERVEWRGRVTPQEIESLYASATCAIFPAAPMVLQMAKCSVRLATTLLHGVPVVASAVGEQANYGAEGAARLVDADATPVEFADTLLDTLDHPAQQHEMIARAQQRLAQHYRWSQLGKRLGEFYRGLGS
jgi:glycosyltransferase involved in cell wall biosynthesis